MLYQTELLGKANSSWFTAITTKCISWFEWMNRNKRWWWSHKHKRTWGKESIMEPRGEKVLFIMIQTMRLSIYIIRNHQNKYDKEAMREKKNDWNLINEVRQFMIKNNDKAM